MDERLLLKEERVGQGAHKPQDLRVAVWAVSLRPGGFPEGFWARPLGSGDHFNDLFLPLCRQDVRSLCSQGAI